MVVQVSLAWSIDAADTLLYHVAGDYEAGTLAS